MTRSIDDISTSHTDPWPFIVPPACTCEYEITRILHLKYRSPLHNFGFAIIDLVDVNVDSF